MPKKITYESEHKMHQILADYEQGLSCFEEILTVIKDRIDYMVSKHCRVLFIRFDVRYPACEGSPIGNNSFDRFIADFAKYLRYHKLDCHYIWCKEFINFNKPHYHMVMLLDGNKTKSIYNHLAKADELWARSLGLPQETKGLIDYCIKASDGSPQENGLMIERNAPDFNIMYDRCYQWASYLAKANTKGCGPKFAKEFSCSQIPTS